jgi:hypothetical protein
MTFHSNVLDCECRLDNPKLLLILRLAFGRTPGTPTSSLDDHPILFWIDSFAVGPLLPNLFDIARVPPEGSAAE